MNKLINKFFIAALMLTLMVPLFFCNTKKGVVSVAENRYLAEFPSVYDENGKVNSNLKLEFTNWFADNSGLRDQMIQFNTLVNYKLFGKLTTDFYLGKEDVLNYATPEILVDYQHKNLRTNEQLKQIVDSYTTIDNYLKNLGIQTYYVQCYDKHSIYPEYFMDGVLQYGDLSKTRQLSNELENTSLNFLSLYDVLLNEKKNKEVYSKFGDATHWNDYGAYIGYKEIMDLIKQNNPEINILNDDDYEIKNEDTGSTFSGIVHFENFEEKYYIKSPKAVLNDVSELKSFGFDPRHRSFTNTSVKNKKTILILGDSYIDSFILDDISESFYKTYMIWGDFLTQLPQMIQEIQPDIILFENAERVDRTNNMIQLADLITSQQNVNQ